MQISRNEDHGEGDSADFKTYKAYNADLCHSLGFGWGWLTQLCALTKQRAPRPFHPAQRKGLSATEKHTSLFCRGHFWKHNIKQSQVGKSVMGDEERKHTLLTTSSLVTVKANRAQL